MCTVSWRFHASGHSLWSNRDERHTRSDSAAPSLGLSDGLRRLAPVDPDGGGSWIAVNERGLTVCLVNRYHGEDDLRPATEDDPGRFRSRGLLVLDLVGADTLPDIHRRLERADLARSRSFELVVLHGHAGLRLGWDGRSLERAELSAGDGHLPLLVSSPLDPTGVGAAREQAFRRFVDGTSDGHDHFHRSHEPSAGSYSPCMHGRLARTRSLTRVDVDAHTVTLTHEGDSPCARRPAEVVQVPLR